MNLPSTLTGYNQKLPQQSKCDPCPAGYYCPKQTDTPTECPRYHYCPEATTVPLTCPNGTFTEDDMTGLANASQCLPCIRGSYCRLGQVIAPCHGGYFCRSGSSDPNPSGTSGDARMCKPGHYCPNGTKTEIPCPGNTRKPGFGGDGVVADCKTCPPGLHCYNGKLRRTPGTSHFPLPPWYRLANSISTQLISLALVNLWIWPASTIPVTNFGSHLVSL